MEIDYNRQWTATYNAFVHTWTYRAARGMPRWHVQSMCDDEVLRQDNPTHCVYVENAAISLMRSAENSA